MNLEPYNIEIVNLGERDFFKTYVSKIELSLNEEIISSEEKECKSKQSRVFFEHLEIALRTLRTNDFVREILSIVDFDTKGRTIRTAYPIPLIVNGKRKAIQTSLCLEKRDGSVLLLIQEK